MFVEPERKNPKIHATAYIAPNANVSGDVVIGEGSRILFDTVIDGNNGTVKIGNHCIVMEAAVIKGTEMFPTVKIFPISSCKSLIFVSQRIMSAEDSQRKKA